MLLKHKVKLLTAFTILVAVIIWVEAEIGFARVLQQWQNIPLLPLFGVICLVMASQFLRGWRVLSAYRLLPGNKKLPAAGGISVSLLHNAANFLLPMRLGELALPILSRTHLSVDLKSSTLTLFGLRLLDLYCVLLFLLILQWPFLIEHYPVIAKLAGLLFVIAPFLMPTAQHLPLLGKLAPPQFARYQSGFYCLLQTLIIWSVKLVGLYSLFLLLLPDKDLTLANASSAIIIADLSAILPINGIASAGSYELAFGIGLAGFDNQAGMSLSGISPAHISAALNLHIFLVFTNVLSAMTGLLILMFVKTDRQNPAAELPHSTSSGQTDEAVENTST